MSYNDLQDLNDREMHICKSISIIYKSQTIFMNSLLKDLNINSAQLQVLFEVSNDSRINQEKIASRCNTDKGAIARSIRKLEDNGLVERKADENNRRQNIIRLTQKGEDVLKKAVEVFDCLEKELFRDIEDIEKLQVLLKDLAINSIKLNNNRLIKNDS